MTDLAGQLQILMGRLLDIQAALSAANLEAALDDLGALVRDADDMRDDVWGELHPEED